MEETLKLKNNCTASEDAIVTRAFRKDPSKTYRDSHVKDDRIKETYSKISRLKYLVNA